MSGWLPASIIATLIGTIILVLAYLHLYRQERESFLGIWALSWSLYAVRFMLIMLGLDHPNPMFFLAEQWFTLWSGLTLLWGTYRFMGRAIPRTWLYLAALGTLYSAVAVALEFSFIWATLPTFAFLGPVYIWTGWVFLQCRQTGDVSHQVAGWSFIIWGLHKTDYPFLRPLLWFAPWGFLLGATLELTLTLGTILVYFQRTRQALIANRKQYENLIGTMNEGLVVIGTDGRVTFVNQSLCRLVGYAAEEIVGHGPTQFLDAANQAKYRDVMARRAQGTWEVYEIEMLTKDGRGLPVSISPRPLYGPDGLLTATMAVIADMTARKRAEAERLRAVRGMTAMLESVSDGFFSLEGPEFVVTYFNQAAEKLLGRGKEEVLGRPLFDAFPEARGSIFETSYRQAYNDGKPLAFEFFFDVPPYVNWYDVRVYPRENGLTVYFQVTTEKKIIEEQIRESESRYRALVENAPLGIITVDQAGRIQEVNDQLLQILGSPSAEATRAINLFEYPPLVAAGVSAGFRKGFETGQSGIFEAPYKSVWGKQTFLRGHVRPLRGPDGQITQVLGLIEDVSGQKALENQLRQAQKMQAIGTLAGGIAHDFNNILGVMIGYTELAQMDLPPNCQAIDSLAEVLLAGKRAKDLVRRILNFSRPAEQERRPVDMEILIKETLKLLRATLPTTIDIRSQFVPRSVLVMADPTQVHQVLMNLCTNAAQAMGQKGGTLTVELDRVELDPENAVLLDNLPSGPYLRLTVTDTGPGMEPRILERIFEPFFTTKKQHEGSGMGLAVVYGIVKSHGGAIKAYSQKGQGAAFKIYLPIIAQQGEPESKNGSAPLLPGSERILFVDDEEALVDSGRRILERLGYKVTCRTSSREALELFRTNPGAFDLVITDQTMPHLTGTDLIRSIAALRPELPIILCTGFSQLVDGETAMAAGARRFLMKPLMLQDVARTIRELLDENKGGSERETAG